jgi:hypothetical protein
VNKNQNPLNIKNNPCNPWKGSSTDERGHAVFVDPAMGIRAGLITMEKKWQNGKRTLRSIINEWAPASDTQGSLPGRPANDPGAYAIFVAKAAGIKPDTALEAPGANPWAWAPIIHAMSKYEMGEYCPRSVIARGISLWLAECVEVKAA